MSLHVVRNDITKMNTEAIVNTANSWCAVGPGCDSAIYNAAGYDQLLAYRREHVGMKNEGDAFITPGFKLAARYIIHVVSPLYTDGCDNEDVKLRNCYRNAFAIAQDNGITSISFPLIATGSFGYPKADALRIALDECNTFLLENEMDINIVVFDSDSTQMAQKLYPKLDEFISINYVSDKIKDEYRGLTGNRASAIAYEAPKRSRLFSTRKKSEPKKTEQESVYPECEPRGLEYELVELENSPALAERMNHLQDTFGEYFFYLVESKGLSSSDVQNRAWITKQVYSKIKTNKAGYKPSKRVAMQLCIGLELSMDESIDLLARAGFAFSPADKQDLIFRFFIENECYDIIGISDALQEYGMEPIIDF